MNQYIPTTSEPLTFTPKSLPEGVTGVFQIQPATEADMDRLGYELFRRNIVPPSNDTYRALMIEEVFTLYGDEEGEARADLLDTYWQAEDVFREQMTAWYQQEAQRMFDENNGAEPKRPGVLPTRIMGLRDRNRAQILLNELLSASRKVRDLSVEMNSFEPKQRAAMARLLILGWSGFETAFARDDDIVTEEAWTALRREIGKPAMQELETFAIGQTIVTETERGNLGSPLETGPGQTPSPQPNGESDSSDGASTSEAETTRSTSNSEPIPASESDETIAVSSTSTSALDGDRSNTEATPVEALSERPSA